MGDFQEVLLIMLSLIANLKLLSAFYSWNFFNLQVREFKNYKEVKRIMILIIVIIYIFYLMLYFINSWKLLLENSKPTLSLEKSTPPLKIQNVQVPRFWRFFRPSLQRGERGVGHCAVL